MEHQTPISKPENAANKRASGGRGASACSPVGRVEWRGANLHSNIEGVTVPAWILSVNGRPILHAVALSEITEPVSAEDRKMIGQALAEYLANH
jgi:hypothetical protein